MMSANRNILIWIGVFTIIGIILLAVACETDLLSAQKPQLVEETEENGNTKTQATDQPGDIQSETRPEGKSDTLTIGKPYSRKLVEEDTSNILIIGEDKLNNLYDTIGIINIDKRNKLLKFIMIPRDTYIEYNQEILSRLEALKLTSTPGVFKINYAHHVGNAIGYKGKFKSNTSSFLAEVVKEKFGVEMDDYVKINLKGFIELVNHLGGVDIYVPYDMDYDDPQQNLSIHIAKGMQHLDGLEAEGFVRFRQGYKKDGSYFEVGDASRKKNQMDLMKALVKQKGTIKNIGMIPGTISLLGRNVQHSIGVGDILQKYMGMAKDVILDEYEVTSESLGSEKMLRINGSSYLVFD